MINIRFCTSHNFLRRFSRISSSFRQMENASNPVPNSSSHQQQRVSDTIIPHLLNLYASRATAADFEIYAADASFEDPLMSAHGVKQIKSAFYSIPKIFKESQIVDYTIQENELSPGKQEVLIDNKQQYVIFGKSIEMISLIKLQVENGKIIRHEDCWEKKPIENRETAKLRMLGRLKEIVRRGSMFATHAAMGFGKDPPAQAQSQPPST